MEFEKEVIRLEEPKEIFPAYQKALEREVGGYFQAEHGGEG